jgi:hypothetical protein
MPTLFAWRCPLPALAGQIRRLSVVGFLVKTIMLSALPQTHDRAIDRPISSDMAFGTHNQSLAKFGESEASNHMPSLANFTTTTPELKFSVHTG